MQRLVDHIAAKNNVLKQYVRLEGSSCWPPFYHTLLLKQYVNSQKVSNSFVEELIVCLNQSISREVLLKSEFSKANILYQPIAWRNNFPPQLFSTILSYIEGDCYYSPAKVLSLVEDHLNVNFHTLGKRKNLLASAATNKRKCVF